MMSGSIFCHVLNADFCPEKILSPVSIVDSFIKTVNYPVDLTFCLEDSRFITLLFLTEAATVPSCSKGNTLHDQHSSDCA